MSSTECRPDWYVRRQAKRRGIPRAKGPAFEREAREFVARVLEALNRKPSGVILNKLARDLEILPEWPSMRIYDRVYNWSYADSTTNPGIGFHRYGPGIALRCYLLSEPFSAPDRATHLHELSVLLPRLYRQPSGLKFCPQCYDLPERRPTSGMCKCGRRYTPEKPVALEVDARRGFDWQ